MFFGGSLFAQTVAFCSSIALIIVPQFLEEIPCGWLYFCPFLFGWKASAGRFLTNIAQKITTSLQKKFLRLK